MTKKQFITKTLFMEITLFMETLLMATLLIKINFKGFLFLVTNSNLTKFFEFTISLKSQTRNTKLRDLECTPLAKLAKQAKQAYNNDFTVEPPVRFAVQSPVRFAVQSPVNFAVQSVYRLSAHPGYNKHFTVQSPLSVAVKSLSSFSFKEASLAVAPRSAAQGFASQLLQRAKEV
jgi:hypothetical protein